VRRRQTLPRRQREQTRRQRSGSCPQWWCRFAVASCLRARQNPRRRSGPQSTMGSISGSGETTFRTCPGSLRVANRSRSEIPHPGKPTLQAVAVGYTGRDCCGHTAWVC
jgi:hypothetical protein